MAEMKDCPFCSAPAASLTTWGESTIGGFIRWVQCQECHAQGPQARSRAHNQSDEETDAAAVEKWNERAENSDSFWEGAELAALPDDHPLFD